METEVIKKEINLMPEDLYRFQKHIITSQFKPAIIIACTLGFVMMFLMIATSETDLIEKIIKLVLLLIVPVTFIALLFRSMKRSSQRVFGENKLVGQTQRYGLSGEGMQVESEKGYANLKWTDLYKTEESKDLFLFFISKQQAHIMPKKYFDLEGAEAELLRRFMAQAPAGKRSKNPILYILVGLLIYAALFMVILTLISNLSRF